MSSDVDILHHVGVIARDLDAASHQFERLGFTITPVSLPRIPLRAGGAPEPIGVANRCAIFENNYLEILGVVDAKRWASITTEQRGPFDIDRPLRRYEGLHVLHMGANDLEPVYDRLLTNGHNPSPVRPYHRPVDTPDGPQTMRARCLSLPPETLPEALFQIAQHETPELVLQPRYMRHANGAKSIADVIVCVDDAEAVSERYAAVAGKDVQAEGRVRRIRLGYSDVLVTDPAGLAGLLPDQSVPTLPFLAGFTIAADLAVTQTFFSSHDIPVATFNGHIVVPRERACGTSVRFRDMIKP